MKKLLFYFLLNIFIVGEFSSCSSGYKSRGVDRAVGSKTSEVDLKPIKPMGSDLGLNTISDMNEENIPMFPFNLEQQIPSEEKRGSCDLLFLLGISKKLAITSMLLLQTAIQEAVSDSFFNRDAVLIAQKSESDLKANIAYISSLKDSQVTVEIIKNTIDLARNSYKEATNIQNLCKKSKKLGGFYFDKDYKNMKKECLSIFFLLEKMILNLEMES